MDELGDDLGAALAARRELGDAYEREIIGAFVEKVDRVVDARIDDRLTARQGGVRGPERPPRPSGDLIVPIGSLILGIPVSAIVTSTLHGIYGLAALGVAWGGIGVVNVAHAIGRHR